MSIVCMDPNHCTRDDHAAGAGGTLVHLPPGGVIIPGLFDHGVPSDAEVVSVTTTATTTHLTPLYALHGPGSQAFIAGVAAWLVTHDSITRDRVAQLAAEAGVVS